MANDKACGCSHAIVGRGAFNSPIFGISNNKCRYPALDALVRQLVDALDNAVHGEYLADYDAALAAAAKLGYTPTGQKEQHG